MAIKFIIVLAALAVPAMCYSKGAPQGVCDSRTPQHNGAEKQTTPAPYTVKLGKTSVKPGETITVTLSGNSPKDTFKGYLIEALDASNAIVGSWGVDSAKGQTVACNGPDSAVTHVKLNDINDVQFSWTAPASPGEIRFTATVVQSGFVFWVGVESKLTIG